MEAAKERRLSSLLPPLSYETFDTFFEAKKKTTKHTHATNIYSHRRSQGGGRGPAPPQLKYHQ